MKRMSGSESGGERKANEGKKKVKASQRSSDPPRVGAEQSALQIEYEEELDGLRQTLEGARWANLFCPQSLTQDERESAWTRIEVLGFPLQEKFAWACPDLRALEICKSFAPLIEIAAGKGYWAFLLKQMEVDVIAYDKLTAGAVGNWTDVQKGGSEVLNWRKGKHKDVAKGRNLFLCYPDQTEEVAQRCLNQFEGDVIIHVGELISTGTKAGGLQTPWGRSTSSEFQVNLAEAFHCVLVYRLPCLPHAADYLTVWKRSAFVCADADDEDDDFEAEEDEDKVLFRAVPAVEQLPDLTCASPAFAHLLGRA